MRVKTLWHLTLMGLLLWLSSPSSIADQLKTDDGYIIHYNAFSSEILPAEVARSYQIVRSKSRAVLNIVVRKSQDAKSTKTKAVVAKVTATAVNLAGQLKTLEMRQIEEGEAESKAIYYIATFTVSNSETLNFTVKVDPESKGKGKGKEHEIKFRQQFFID